MPDRKQIQLGLMKQICAYSQETGVPIDDCVNEALEEWVECCMTSRLEEFRKQPAPASSEMHILRSSLVPFLITKAS